MRAERVGDGSSDLPSTFTAQAVVVEIDGFIRDLGIISYEFYSL